MKTIMNFVLHAFLSNVVLHTSIFDLGFFDLFQNAFYIHIFEIRSRTKYGCKEINASPKIKFSGCVKIEINFFIFVTK